MPRIYSDLKRQEIAEYLLDTSLVLLKQFGLKKLSIEAVTKKVGIAQGTFYNFFPSKEMLIYELARRYQRRIDEKTKLAVASAGYLSRAELRAIYLDMMLHDEDNVFRYLSREDLQTLVTRLPKDYFHRIVDVKTILDSNLKYIQSKKQDIDLNAVINWIQIMNLTVQNKDLLIESGVHKIISVLIENMLDEIYKEE